MTERRQGKGNAVRRAFHDIEADVYIMVAADMTYPAQDMYCPQFPTKLFEFTSSAEDWVKTFVHWHNKEHLHSVIGFVTPGSWHRGEDIEILAKRHAVYQKARNANPGRWSQNTRNWDRIKKVSLSCLKPRTKPCTK